MHTSLLIKKWFQFFFNKGHIVNITNRSYASGRNKKLINYDVKNRIQNKQSNTRAFCHSPYRNKLHSITAHKFTSNKIPPKQSEINFNTIRSNLASNNSNNFIISSHDLKKSTLSPVIDHKLNTQTDQLLDNLEDRTQRLQIQEQQ